MRVRAELSRGRGRHNCQRHRVLGRDDMLAVVAMVFAQRGYHGTDMELVAEALEHGRESLVLGAASDRFRPLSNA